MNREDNKFSIGEIIFAKVKGFPWWPGTVNLIIKI